MANTYQEIKDSLQELIDRTDVVVTNPVSGNQNRDKLDEWIGNAVRRVYNSRMANTHPFETGITGTLREGTNLITVPENFNGLRRMVFTVDNDNSVPYKSTSDEILATRNDERVYLPYRYARESNTWVFDRPAQDVNFTIYYWGFLPEISTVTDSTTRHFLVNQLGEAIVYWGAVESAAYFGDALDATQVQLWEQRGADIIAENIQRAKFIEASGTTPRAKRPDVYNFRRRSGYGRRGR